MYRHCIFCASALGSNDMFEQFPTGRSVAFDAAKGRLWAVCRGCGRWNLAPIEERWETVEEAEKLFRDARVRVQSERIGLTRLRDGTQLIRIGDALAGEIAALRYGTSLLQRRRSHLVGIGMAAGGGLVLASSFPLIVAAGVPLATFSLTMQAIGGIAQYRRREQVMHRIAADASPTGAVLLVRRRHLYTATLQRDEQSGAPRLTLPPEVLTDDATAESTGDRVPELVLTGPAAERAVSRAITDYNARGATPQQISTALERIVAAGDAAAFVRAIASKPVALSRPSIGRVGASKPYTPRQILGTFRGEVLPVTRYASPFLPDQKGRALKKVDALALEIALHDESERSAMQGELASLEAAWQEAEEIAAIADSLPYDLGPRLRALRGR